jgi:hypothetical protein
MIDRISKFARSPQGHRLTGQAKRWASDPRNRAKIDSARKRLMASRKKSH